MYSLSRASLVAFQHSAALRPYPGLLTLIPVQSKDGVDSASHVRLGMNMCCKAGLSDQSNRHGISHFGVSKYVTWGACCSSREWGGAHIGHGNAPDQEDEADNQPGTMPHPDTNLVSIH